MDKQTWQGRGARSRRRWGWVFGGLAVLTGLLWFYDLARRDTQGGAHIPLYSISRHDPYGLAAWAAFLSEAGVETTALRRSSPEGLSGALVVASRMPDPGGWRFSPEDRRETDLRDLKEQSERARWKYDWASDGHTLLLLGLHQPAWAELLSVPAPRRADSHHEEFDREVLYESGDYETPTPATAPATLTDAGLALAGLASGVLEARADAGWSADELPPAVVVLARTDEGVVTAWLKPCGRGRVIWVADALAATNAHLARGDNLAFLSGAVGRGPVAFDEYARGMGRNDTVADVFWRAGLVPLLFQLLFVLWCWRGQIATELPEDDAPGDATPDDDGGRFARGQARTLGWLYQRTLGSADLAVRVRAEVERRAVAAGHVARGRLRVPPAAVRARLEAARRFKSEDTRAKTEARAMSLLSAWPDTEEETP